MGFASSGEPPAPHDHFNHWIVSILLPLGTYARLTTMSITVTNIFVQRYTEGAELKSGSAMVPSEKVGKYT